MNFTLSRISQHLLIDNFSIYLMEFAPLRRSDIRTPKLATQVFPGDPNGENR